ncbi:hypothetical protein HDV00_009181 [Rhizophlyctis rosea]|nr:hypothetical protein HDV00_009181 [Rhizophlyctis rosea]
MKPSPSFIAAKCRVGTSRKSTADLYYELHGSGKRKVLFVTTQYFARKSDYQVCVYENRGSGHSSAPMRRYRMSDMAQDANDLLRHLGWSRVHVVGASMGGMIAQEFALHYPHRLKSLCLASTQAQRCLPPTEFLPHLLLTLLRISISKGDDIAKLVPSLLYSSEWLSAPALETARKLREVGQFKGELIVGMGGGGGVGGTVEGDLTNLEVMLKFHKTRLTTRPPQRITAAMAQLWGIIRHHIPASRLHLLSQALSSHNIPTTIAHGTADKLIHTDSARALAEAVGGRLVLFGGIGHSLNHEDPVGFNGLLEEGFERGEIGRGVEVDGVGSDGKEQRVWSLDGQVL